MKATVEDEKLQGKINNKDKQKILDKCEIVSWLDTNQTAEKKEFEHQKKELENVCSPIIIQLYQSSRGITRWRNSTIKKAPRYSSWHAS